MNIVVDWPFLLLRQKTEELQEQAHKQSRISLLLRAFQALPERLLRFAHEKHLTDELDTPMAKSLWSLGWRLSERGRRR